MFFNTVWLCKKPLRQLSAALTRTTRTEKNGTRTPSWRLSTRPFYPSQRTFTLTNAARIARTRSCSELSARQTQLTSCQSQSSNRQSRSKTIIVQLKLSSWTWQTRWTLVKVDMSLSATHPETSLGPSVCSLSQRWPPQQRICLAHRSNHPSTIIRNKSRWKWWRSQEVIRQHGMTLELSRM